MSIFERFTGSKSSKAREKRRILREEEVDYLDFQAEKNDAALKTAEAQVAEQIAQMELLLARARAQSASIEEIRVEKARLDKIAQKQVAESSQSLQRLESFGSKTWSFVQEVLILCRIRKENSVKLKRLELEALIRSGQTQRSSALNAIAQQAERMNGLRSFMTALGANTIGTTIPA